MIFWLKKSLYRTRKWFSNSDYRAYQWLLIRFGDIEPAYQQLVYFKNHRFEVPDLPEMIEEYRRLYLEKDLQIEGKRESIIVDLLADIGISAAWIYDHKPTAKGFLYCQKSAHLKFLQENLNQNKWIKMNILEEQSAASAWMKVLSLTKVVNMVRASPGGNSDLNEELLKNLHKIEGLCLYFPKNEQHLFSQWIHKLDADYHLFPEYRKADQLTPHISPYFCLKAYRRSKE